MQTVLWGWDLPLGVIGQSLGTKLRQDEADWNVLLGFALVHK